MSFWNNKKICNNGTFCENVNYALQKICINAIMSHSARMKIVQQWHTLRQCQLCIKRTIYNNARIHHPAMKKFCYNDTFCDNTTSCNIKFWNNSILLRQYQILRPLLLSPILATCPVQINLLNLITLIILGELYKLSSSSLWSLLHSPFSSLLGPNIRLRILFSNTLSINSSL